MGTFSLYDWALENEKKWNALEERARQEPLKAVRFRAGLYFVVGADNQLHTIEFVTSDEGFHYNEWTISTGSDLHHDQYSTLKDALASLGAHL